MRRTCFLAILLLTLLLAAQPSFASVTCSTDTNEFSSTYGDVTCTESGPTSPFNESNSIQHNSEIGANNVRNQRLIDAQDKQTKTIEIVGGAIGAAILIGAVIAFSSRRRSTTSTPSRSQSPKAARSPTPVPHDDRLNQLISAFDRGLLTKEEFEKAKQGVLPSAVTTQTASQAPASVAAGWYPDERAGAPSGRQRYWDGTQWTDWDSENTPGF